jgi:hypothetical protein
VVIGREVLHLRFMLTGSFSADGTHVMTARLWASAPLVLGLAAGYGIMSATSVSTIGP